MEVLGPKYSLRIRHRKQPDEVVQQAAAGLIPLWLLKVIIFVGTLTKSLQPKYSFLAIACQLRQHV